MVSYNEAASEVVAMRGIPAQLGQGDAVERCVGLSVA
jgi:hypothetical protein